MSDLAVHIPTLTTERLTLRAPRPEDFEAFAQVMTSPRAGYMGGPYTHRAAAENFAAAAGSWVLRGYGGWTVTRRGEDAWLGEVAIAQPPRFPEPEIGWSFAAASEGKGYATEAARAALDWARGRVASLVSYVDVDNARSIALTLRLGAARDDDARRPDGEGPDETHVYRHWGPA